MLDLCGFAETIYKQHLKTFPFLFSHFDSTQGVCRGILMYRNYGGTHIKMLLTMMVVFFMNIKGSVEHS